MVLEPITRLIGEGLLSHKASMQNWERCACFLSPKCPNFREKKKSRTKKQGSMTQSKEQNKILQTNCKEMQIYELSDKEFKITVIKILSEPKENTTKLNQESDLRTK